MPFLPSKRASFSQHFAMFLNLGMLRLHILKVEGKCSMLNCIGIHHYKAMAWQKSRQNWSDDIGELNFLIPQSLVNKNILLESLMLDEVLKPPSLSKAFLAS